MITDYKEILKLAEERRSELISNLTKSELLIKSYLDNLGIIYELQKIVYTDFRFYIVDFYLPKQNLIIEIDGLYHGTAEQNKKDIRRTKELKKLGYKNIRRLTNERAEKLTQEMFNLLIQNFGEVGSEELEFI